MSRAYLGLGSNLGDTTENLLGAAKRISALPGTCITRSSSLFETAPWGYVDQPWFLNAVLETETSLEPHELLRRVKSIEQAMGRTPGLRWGPRLIDIDILLYDQVSIDEPDLIIPHPRICERLFVLAPLAELLPEWKCPGGESVSQRASRLGDDAGIRRLAGDWII